MLTVKALRCVNLRNVVAVQGSTERQDPYVTLTLEENQKLHTKTDVCYSGGTNPQWYQGNWMRLPIPKTGMTCLVQVWDKHSGDADELIASGKIKLSRYDEDGTEEEPLSVDLYWQNGEPAGKFHCIVSYDPPYTPHVQQSDQMMSSAMDDSARYENWIPWMRVQMRHRSGKVKDFFISRTRQSVEQGRNLVSTRVPQYRSMAYDRVNSFKTRSIIEQAGFIAMVILLVVTPWPRAIMAWGYHAVFDTLGWVLGSLYSGTVDTFSAIFGTMFAGLRWFWSLNWSITTAAMGYAFWISMFTVVPAMAVLCGPRAMGLAMTKLATWVLGGHLVSFGTVTFVPWITDFKRLKVRFILVDFLFGNPKDKGYTPRMASFNRVEFVGSIAFADIPNLLMFRKVRTPLKDVPDFDKLLGVRIDHLEIDGLAINLEVNDKNKLNLLEILSEYDRGQVNRALAKRDINATTFRFPNCLEVQVLGARNLRAMDMNGLADPFYVCRVRKQELVSSTVVKTLNPAFPPRVEQFYVDDPSAVLSIELRDEDVARTSDFIGQWNTTAKWLLMDPKNMKHIEWDRLPDDERRQGWIGFWAPLVDENFRQEGACGEVHLRIRWIFNPALPVFRPGERKETQTPMQQLATLAREVRERLGDLQYIIDILKHIPILLDFQGVLAVNDAKISIHDLLFGRRRDQDNLVKKVITKQREELDQRMSKQVDRLPRSLDVRETPAALNREKLDAEMRQLETSVDKTDAIEEVVVTSTDPSGAKLPRNLEIDVTTIQPGAVAESMIPPMTTSAGTTSTTTGSSATSTSTTTTAQQQRVLDSQIGLQQGNITTDNNRPVVTTQQEVFQSTVEKELGTGDKLNAVYPEKLVTSSVGNTGYVRGELVDLRRDLGPDTNVYLGDEEDDDAAEERNEDRFDDDRREFDQDGREFVKIRPIIWRKQFLTRHGDPGINVYKFLERLVLGLIPKLASDERLQKAVAGPATKGFFTGDLSIFHNAGETRAERKATMPSSTTGTQPRGLGHKIVGEIKGAAHTVKDQTKLVAHKIAHPRQDETVAAAAFAGEKTPAYVREGEDYNEEKSHEPMSASRPVHGTDTDFNRNDLLIAGGLEAVWQGRHRITSLFRRWKPWHMEVKGDTVFYHRISSSGLSTHTATEGVWYTLDLTWLSDVYITDSSRLHNNELVLKFVQDDSSLHLRLPSRVTTPTLENWLAAFRKVAKAQQDRRRLGTAASLGEETTSYQTASTTAWPGEDTQPQQRQRGSSLAVNYSLPTQALMKEEKVNVETVNISQMPNQKYEATINPSDKVDFTQQPQNKSTDMGTQPYKSNDMGTQQSYKSSMDMGTQPYKSSTDMGTQQPQMMSTDVGTTQPQNKTFTNTGTQTTIETQTTVKQS